MTRRRGFTIVELLSALVVVSVLVALSIPRVRDFQRRAMATEVVGQLEVARLALLRHNSDHGTWPPDVPAGVVPAALAPYLPAGFAFRGTGYTLEYDAVTPVAPLRRPLTGPAVAALRAALPLLQQYDCQYPAELSRLQAEIDLITRQQAAIDAEKAQKDREKEALDRQKAELDAQKDQLDRRKSDINKEIAALNQEQAQLRSRRRQLSDAEYARQMAALEAEEEALRAERDGIDPRKAELDRQKEAIDREKQRKDREKQELDRQRQALDQRRQQLQQELQRQQQNQRQGRPCRTDTPPPAPPPDPEPTLPEPPPPPPEPVVTPPAAPGAGSGGGAPVTPIAAPEPSYAPDLIVVLRVRTTDAALLSQAVRAARGGLVAESATSAVYPILGFGATP